MYWIRNVADERISYRLELEILVDLKIDDPCRHY